MSRAVLALVCSGSLMGCIITREPSYSSPPNTPPVVLEDPIRSPFGAVIDIDLSATGGEPDGGVGTQVSFFATVLDPDIEQDLDAIVFIDHRAGESTNEVRLEIDLPPNGDTTRGLEFSVDRAGLPPGCHTLEVHVSSEFVGIRNPSPNEQGDLGRAIWWLHILSNEDDSVDMSTCNSVGGT